MRVVSGVSVKVCPVAVHNLSLRSNSHAVSLNALNPGLWGIAPDNLQGSCMLFQKPSEFRCVCPEHGDGVLVFTGAIL